MDWQWKNKFNQWISLISFSTGRSPSKHWWWMIRNINYRLISVVVSRKERVSPRMERDTPANSSKRRRKIWSRHRREWLNWLSVVRSRKRSKSNKWSFRHTTISVTQSILAMIFLSPRIRKLWLMHLLLWRKKCSTQIITTMQVVSLI